MTKPLWVPSLQRKSDSQLREFQNRVGVPGSYQTLHDFTINKKDAFWSALWDYCEVIGDKGDRILVNADKMPGAKWFPDASLNFAENLLRYDDDSPALISYLENGSRTKVSYSELRQQVESLATWLSDAGINPGDRVVALLPNIPQAIVTMLAATSIGAIFSSCSPDFGVNGVLDRFGQISPRILVTCNGYFYNGKIIDISDRVKKIVAQVDSIEQVLVVDLAEKSGQKTLSPENLSSEKIGQESMALDPIGLEKATDFDSACETEVVNFRYHRQDFDHPLYIMYSSGTTGTPKCIVHSAGGTLLQHLKEHRLHVNLSRKDVFFYFTTCGWMMWNWLVTGLASGASLVLYDGSPFYPTPSAMFDLAAKEKMTIFGTSAKYLASLEKAGLKPKQSHDLSSLHTILSTGSPLSHESFKYVYRDIKEDLCLSSISGGTDIISCFVLGNPTLPVYEGELQCAGLGMDVWIYNDQGEPVKEEKGELVCASPFPSMPAGFWNDPQGKKYHDAYFDRFEGVWAQGDYGEQTVNSGYIIHGRSDAVLNPGGVRIGTAEIYRQVEKIEEVIDAICVGQKWQDDVRVILFVVLREGVTLTDELVAHIKLLIRENTTPRHVPARILAVPDIPRTISGKIVELAVRNVIHGLPVNNKDALANPEALEAFKDSLLEV